MIKQKPVGAYLVDAGLLSTAQVDVILADQQMMEMPFGEIATARGWVKQQTVEYIMYRVIEPERLALLEKADDLRSSMSIQKRGELPPEKTTHPQKTTLSQDLPTPPLDDDEVSWVG
ncbi:MAG: hypothetical protein KME35_18215 [Aphanocapsa sp. GSE-SYN-MK-11-07L]|jgi:hypothetical protein|nr:hypothetical protein [Aphanocapsa sp. GSE-SYN-MK-11-07L]